MNAAPQYDPLSFGENALKLRSYRHEVLGSNITNADTPGYKARDIDFARALHHELKQINHSDTMAMATTARKIAVGRQQKSRREIFVLIEY